MKEFRITINKSDIAKEVDATTSLIGASRFDNNGEMLYDHIRMSEQDQIVFSRLFEEAMMELEKSLYAYTRYSEVSDQNNYNEPQVVIECQFPDTIHPKSLYGISTSAKSYLVYRICGEWLLVKFPQEAQSYLSKCDYYLAQITVLANRRTEPIRR